MPSVAITIDLRIRDSPSSLDSRQTLESLCLLQPEYSVYVLSPDPPPSSSLFFAPNYGVDIHIFQTPSYIPNTQHPTWHRQLHLRHS
ncbi:hypothetical protein ACN38_g230 [Penicillium nordicum]|uniref:Uncharacterized protein n=1 Tax=Penicillium nordicum TaxID=229535 RepID=A0A0M9WKW8_9EURO|nr:hypothetical protein ACN38_g230 [Penicillium nordicum]